MLSILIPVYNFDVRDLVKDLHDQAEKCAIPFEIICLDDFSKEAFKSANKELVSLPFVRYKELNENIGRSRIRNKLSELAKYDLLLFMDCDSRTESKNYISNYLNEVEPSAVLFGGRTYEEEAPADKKKYFRWYYGIHREMIPTKERQIHPYRCFLTNNFLLNKSIFNAIKMDPDLVGYGHEDTLFSAELKARKIRIKHIENPLCHIGLEDTETFLEQTKNGLRNLNLLISKSKIDIDNKLYSASRFFKFRLMRNYLLRWFAKNEKKIENNLKGENPSLRKFDWYKLAYLIKIQDEEKNSATNSKNNV